jgi:hypothetical protein
VLGVTLLVTAGFGLPAEATVVRAMTLREKAETAPVIVHGVVEHVASAFTLDERRIRTTVVLHVIEGLKGGAEPGERLTFVRGGGRVGEHWQHAPGLAEYAAGDEVILFLEPLGATLVAIGIGIGTYEVEVEDLGAGPEPVVVHHPEVAGLRYDAEGRPGRIEPLPPMRPEPLATFKKRVRSYVAGVPDRPVVLPRKQPVELAPPPRVLGAAPSGGH